MPSIRRKLLGLWKNFSRDIRGAVLFYVTATLPALVGFSLLAVDASRLMSLHTSLQKGVDALALAAAGELDHLPGAMNRAGIAISELVENRQVFGTPNGDPIINPSDVTVRFLTELPTNDSDPMPLNSDPKVLDQSNTDNDFIANFVEVTVAPHSMTSIFPASFLRGSNQATAEATAVAGNEVVTCDVAPLWICNPWEDANNTLIYETESIKINTDTRLKRRRQIRMRFGPGGGNNHGPGNYGFLRLGGTGANILTTNLAAGASGLCISVGEGQDLETGQTTGPVETGLNSRFGIYPNSNKIGNISGANANPLSRPAENVRTGRVPGSCVNFTPQPNPMDGMALPRDECMRVGAANPCDRIGDGNWGLAEMQDYWDANFPAAGGSTSMPSPEDVGLEITEPAYQAELEATSWDQLTRYDIYRYEIRAPLINQAAVGGEIGNPALGDACWKGNSVAGDSVDRRLVASAIMNCNALIADGRWGTLNGAEVGVPAAAIAQFFLTEALEQGGGGSAGDILTELVSFVADGQAWGNAKFQVQLYR